MSIDDFADEITALLWRDHDERVNAAIDSMCLGEYRFRLDSQAGAADVYGLGARLVELPTLVDLSGAMPAEWAVRTVALIRDLTAQGVNVAWRLRLGKVVDWHVLSHLWPPREIVGRQAGMVAEWRRTHYLGKCVYRQGPGFVQVRDRRDGELTKFTIDADDHLTTIEPLLQGAATQTIPADVFADYATEDLLMQVGEFAVWLPYRVRRWPIPSMVV
jgi:hypothetical protein